MLKNMEKADVVERVMEEDRTVTTFIYNHGYDFTMMRERCGGDIMRLVLHGLPPNT